MAATQRVAMRWWLLLRYYAQPNGYVQPDGIVFSPRDPADTIGIFPEPVLWNDYYSPYYGNGYGYGYGYGPTTQIVVINNTKQFIHRGHAAQKGQKPAPDEWPSPTGPQNTASPSRAADANQQVCHHGPADAKPLRRGSTDPRQISHGPKRNELRANDDGPRANRIAPLRARAAVPRRASPPSPPAPVTRVRSLASHSLRGQPISLATKQNRRAHCWTRRLAR